MAVKKDKSRRRGVSQAKCETPGRIVLERVRIHVVIANEIMPDFAVTLVANHPDTNDISEDMQIWEAA